MNTTLKIHPAEIEIPELDVAEENVPTQPGEAERDRWIWTFERLKNADLGLSFSEKAKVFCEGTSPEQIEEFIQIKLEERRIIPLAA